ncbi:MAG: YkgJ family cysteine cluster protein [Candidatus Eremiobacterota bacterium]
MNLQFLPGQNFECADCSRCCRSKWNIHVDETSREKIRGSPLELRVIQEFGQALVDEEGSLSRVAKRADGACVFLDERELCRIHAEIDRKAKPIGCRQYPFMIRPTPDGVVIGASFYCPSIQRNSGRPLATYQDELEELIREYGYQPLGFQPIPAGAGRMLEWPAYSALERHLLQWLSESPAEAALARGVWALGSLLARQPDSPIVLPLLAPRLTDPPSHRLEEDEVLGTLREFFLAALIATVEAPHPEMARPLTEELLEGRPVELSKLGWRGTLPGLYVFLSGPGPATTSPLEKGIRRYLEALLFRKFLAMERPVLDNLAALSLIPGLLRFYHFVAGLASPDAPPEQHLYAAYDVAEMELVTHSFGVSPLFAGFASAFLDQLVLLPD